MEERTCSVDGCGRPPRAKAQGMCNMHNLRVRQYGDPGPAESHVQRRSAVCTIPGCGRPHEARGWCATHYIRWRQHGDPLVDVPVRAWREYKKKGRLCNIPGCEQPHAARGWCDVHYKRWKAHGDPTALLQAAPRQADHYTTKGYHIIYANGRAVQEHRHVMEQHLGRPLLPNENVHHRDGNKARNDIGNLELWITHQPSGQRVADLVAFVVERYAEQVARMLREQRRGAKPTEHPTLW